MLRYAIILPSRRHSFAASQLRCFSCLQDAPPALLRHYFRHFVDIRRRHADTLLAIFEALRR